MLRLNHGKKGRSTSFKESKDWHKRSSAILSSPKPTCQLILQRDRKKADLIPKRHWTRSILYTPIILPKPFYVACKLPFHPPLLIWYLHVDDNPPESPRIPNAPSAGCAFATDTWGTHTARFGRDSKRWWLEIFWAETTVTVFCHLKNGGFQVRNLLACRVFSPIFRGRTCC